MEVLIYGYSFSKGVFTNDEGKQIPYDNIKVHCAMPSNSETSVGYIPIEGKLKNTLENLKELASYQLPSKVEGVFESKTYQGNIQTRLVGIKPLKKA